MTEAQNTTERAVGEEGLGRGRNTIHAPRRTDHCDACVMECTNKAMEYPNLFTAHPIGTTHFHESMDGAVVSQSTHIWGAPHHT